MTRQRISATGGEARLVRVPLLGGGEVVIPAAAHAHLIGMNYSGEWFVGADRQGCPHVRVCRGDMPAFKPAFAWRSVMRDADGWRGPVAYADGNPLNLRPENLLRRTPTRRHPGGPWKLLRSASA